MTATRVVLAGIPRLCSEIVRELLAVQPGLDIAAEVPDRDALVPALDTTGATLAVIALEPNESPAVVGDLLRTHPGLVVIAIDAEARAAFLCELRVQMSAITELSPPSLLRALRGLGDLHPSLHLFSVQRSIEPFERMPEL